MVPFSPSAGEGVKKRKAVLRLARKLWKAMYCFLAPEDAPVFSVKAWLEYVAKVCSKGAVAEEPQAALTWNDVGMACGGGSGAGAGASSSGAKVAEARGACKVSERMQVLEAMEKEHARLKRRLNEVVAQRKEMVSKFQKCCASFARAKPQSGLAASASSAFTSVAEDVCTEGARIDELDRLSEAQVKLRTRVRDLSRRAGVMSGKITFTRTSIVDEVKGTLDEIAQERERARSRWDKVKVEALAQLKALGYHAALNEEVAPLPDTDNMRVQTLAYQYEVKDAERRQSALLREQKKADEKEEEEEEDDNDVEKRWERSVYGFPCNQWAQCTGEGGLGLKLTVAPNRLRCGVIVKKESLHALEYALALEAYDEHYGIDEAEKKQEDPDFMHKAVTDTMDVCVPVYVLSLSQVQLDSEEIMYGRHAPPAVWVFGDWFDGARFAHYDPIQRVPLSRLACLPPLIGDEAEA